MTAGIYDVIAAMRSARAITWSKTGSGTMIFSPLRACRSSRWPAFPRKMSGEALTTTDASGIPQLSGEVLVVDHEHVNTPAREFRKELCTRQAGRFRSPFHRSKGVYESRSSPRRHEVAKDGRLHARRIPSPPRSGVASKPAHGGPVRQSPLFAPADRVGGSDVVVVSSTKQRLRHAVYALTVRVTGMAFVIALLGCGGTNRPDVAVLNVAERNVASARFGPRGQVIATLEEAGFPPRVFSLSSDAAPVLIGFPDSRLAAVSRDGALALLANYGADGDWFIGGFRGTLTRVSDWAQQPQRVIGDVAWADISSSSGQILVVRGTDNRPKAFRPADQAQAIEFPVGSTIYRTERAPSPLLPSDDRVYWQHRAISHPRISPDGKQIAAFESVRGGIGDIVLVDLTGNRRVLSAGWQHVSGLAWTPDSESIVFSAAYEKGDLALRQVTLSGQLTDRPLQMDGSAKSVAVQDIDREGNLLISTVAKLRLGVRFDNDDGPGADVVVQSSSAVDSGNVGGVNVTEFGRDGSWIAVTAVPNNRDEGQVQSSVWQLPSLERLLEVTGIVVTTYSPHRKLGAGVAVKGNEERVYVVDGLGQPPRPIDTPGLVPTAVRWFPNGTELLMAARVVGSERLQLYAITTDGNGPIPLSREGVHTGTKVWSSFGVAISPDSRRVVAIDDSFSIRAFSSEGGPGALLPDPDSWHRYKAPVGWSTRSEAFYMSDEGSEKTVEIREVDLETGKTRVALEVTPNRVSVEPVNVQVSADLARFAYTYFLTVSHLAVIKAGKW